jgi:hypothetical protein
MNVALSISDFLTFSISLAGIIISLAYILFQTFHTERNIESEQETISIFEWIRKDGYAGKRLKVVLEDYKTSNEEVRRRDNVTLIVGTILITSSFLILGNVALKPDQPKSIYALASIGLFSIWLFALHETGKRLNKITYDRLKAIEKALMMYFDRPIYLSEDAKPSYRFGIHSLVCEKTAQAQTDWWLRARRMFWAFVLLLLSLSWMILS